MLHDIFFMPATSLLHLQCTTQQYVSSAWGTATRLRALDRTSLQGCERIGASDLLALLAPGHSGVWGYLTSKNPQLLVLAATGNPVPMIRHALKIPHTSMVPTLMQNPLT